MQKKELEVVLKITERCNLNCSYCYYFNKSNQSWHNYPALLAEHTIEDLCHFLKQSVIENMFTFVKIDLHGGEPLLLGKKRFVSLCQKLKETLEPVTTLKIVIQTNATLIDLNWSNILHYYCDFIGVSLDGTAETHDIYRVNKKGHPTYHQTEEGIKILQSRIHHKKPIGIICVINPTTDAEEIYHHFVHNLKINYFHFILPDYSHDEGLPYSVSQYTSYLKSLLTAWLNDDNPEIHISLFDQLLRTLSEHDNRTQPRITCTIQSNGQITPNDSLRNTELWQRCQKYSIIDHSLNDYLTDPVVQKIHTAENHPPSQCQSCQWMNICRGGSLIGRLFNNNFQQVNVYCHSMRTVFRSLSQQLLQAGYPYEKLQSILYGMPG